MADNTIDFPPMDCPQRLLLGSIPLDNSYMGQCKPIADIARIDEVCDIPPKNKYYR